MREEKYTSFTQFLQIFFLCSVEATSTVVIEVFLKVKYIFFPIKRCQVYNHQQSLLSTGCLLCFLSKHLPSQPPNILGDTAALLLSAPTTGHTKLSGVSSTVRWGYSPRTLVLLRK